MYMDNKLTHLTRLQELVAALDNETPKGPWFFIKADDLDDWQLHDDEYTFFKQDDSGVPITPEVGKFIVASRILIVAQMEIIKEMSEAFDKVLWTHVQSFSNESIKIQSNITNLKFCRKVVEESLARVEELAQKALETTNKEK